MSNITSVVNFNTEAQARECLVPSTMNDLKNSITNVAWKLLNSVECIRFPKYDNSYEVQLPYLLQGVVVLVRSSDGVVLDKYGRYYGISEWKAIQDICKKYFKRGKSASDFKILFMTEEEFKTAKLKYVDGDSCYYFNV